MTINAKTKPIPAPDVVFDFVAKQNFSPQSTWKSKTMPEGKISINYCFAKWQNQPILLKGK